MGSLTLTRCFNHGQREAVARCPSCHRHYCRECVTEHDHKLLCASCIQALATNSESTERRRWPLVPGLQLALAVFVLWIAFYAVGQSLLLIPSEFQHFEAGFFDETENSESGSNAAEVPATEAWAPPVKAHS